MLDNLMGLIKKDLVAEKSILEYSKGFKVFGSSYIKRIGTPGNYLYIYPTKKLSKTSRRFNKAFTRFISKKKKFLKKLSLRYEAKSMNLKPKTATSGILTIKKNNGGIIDMHVNLKSHGIYSYRSRKGPSGTASTLAKSKRKGLLRYR